MDYTPFVGIDDAKQLWYFRIPKKHLGSCQPTNHVHLVTERWPILSITPAPDGDSWCVTIQSVTGESQEIILGPLGPTQLLVNGYNWSVYNEPRPESTYLKRLFERPDGPALKEALDHLNLVPNPSNTAHTTPPS